MSYSRSEDFVFEWERSVNKENFINYDASSMAAGCSQLDDLVSDLFIECEIASLITAAGDKTRQNAETRLKQDMRSLLWHLFRAQRVSRDCYVRISLSTHSFKHDPRRNPFGISRDIAKIIRKMDAAKKFNLCIGFDDASTGNSRFTRVRANLNLLNRLRQLPKRLSSAYVELPAIEFRTKKDGVRKVVENPLKLQKLDEIEALVKRQNQLVGSRKITLQREDGEFLQWADVNGQGHSVDLTRTSLTAIFHVDEKNTVSYGRMHGAFWQSIPSRYRKDILIDGTPTVELDYSAQILSMAAGHAKVQISGDPYAVDLGLDKLGSKIQRKIVKSCLVIMFNVDSQKSAIKAIRSKIYKEEFLLNSVVTLTDATILGFFGEIFLTYPFLRKYAFKGLGKMFFFHDSEIARTIMKTFIDLNKVVLPIHDGFIAKEEDSELLRKAMEDAWAEKFGTMIGIKAE